MDNRGRTPRTTSSGVMSTVTSPAMIELLVERVGGESATFPGTHSRRPGGFAKDAISTRLRGQFCRGLSEHDSREILDVGRDETVTHLAHHSRAEEREGAPGGRNGSAGRGLGRLIAEGVLDVRLRGEGKIAIAARPTVHPCGGE